MDKRKREALGTGIFIILVLLGDMFGGEAFKWAWILLIGVLFVFFSFITDDNKPKKFEERK